MLYLGDCNSASISHWRSNTLTMKQQLEMKDNEKMLFFNDCNFQVAVLCNHCKTPAKNFGDKQEEKKKQLEEMEKVRKVIVFNTRHVIAVT